MSKIEWISMNSINYKSHCILFNCFNNIIYYYIIVSVSCVCARSTFNHHVFFTKIVIKLLLLIVNCDRKKNSLIVIVWSVRNVERKRKLNFTHTHILNIHHSPAAVFRPSFPSPLPLFRRFLFSSQKKKTLFYENFCIDVITNAHGKQSPRSSWSTKLDELTLSSILSMMNDWRPPA